MKLLVFMFILCLFISSCVQAETEKITLGAGWGSGYGRLLGVNANYRIMPKLDLLGMAGVGDRWGVGFRYHLTNNLYLSTTHSTCVWCECLYRI